MRPKCTRRLKTDSAFALAWLAPCMLEASRALRRERHRRTAPPPRDVTATCSANVSTGDGEDAGPLESSSYIADEAYGCVMACSQRCGDSATTDVIVSSSES